MGEAPQAMVVSIILLGGVTVKAICAFSADIQMAKQKVNIKLFVLKEVIGFIGLIYFKKFLH